mmetsp:Transcript_86614/g.197676  ORF Transcript_86614/g.197676 Transcript_86614/m.197676 type:complete len:290 (+) Transcript_86614:1-870(+)
MIDRFELLQHHAQPYVPAHPGQDDDLDAFLAHAQGIRSLLDAAASGVQSERQLHQAALAATTKAKEKQASAQAVVLMGKVLNTLQTAKGQVQEARNQVETWKRTHHGGSAAERIRTGVVGQIGDRLQAIFCDHQQAVTSYQTALQAKVSRHVRMAYPDLDAGSVAELVESGRAAEAIQQALSGTASTADLQNTLADMRDKAKDLRKLDESVRDLHSMFVELSVLVDRQGEMIDRIEESVSSAADYTGKAEQQLVRAQALQRQYQRRMICIYCSLALMVLLALMHLVGIG